MSFLSFSRNDIDPNKAHGHDMISIRMLKICGEYISKPLKIIFKSCIKRVSLLTNGTKQTRFQSIKKVIRKCQETIDLLHYF